MPDLDTKLTALDNLTALLDAGANVLIAKIDGQYRIATALQLDGHESDADNDYPNLVLLSGLDPDGEYCIECSEAQSLADALQHVATLNCVHR